MNPTDRAKIEQNSLFHGMDFNSAEYMLEHSTLRNLEVGERLLQPDIQSQHLHLILEGKLNVYLIAQQTQEYATLHAGECVGEVSLVDGKYPSAIVLAKEPTRILSIPYDTVWSLINNSHVVAGNLLSILASRLRNDNTVIIDYQAQKKLLEYQASVDVLTGIHNRYWMSKAFPRALRRCARDKQPFALMLVDVDHFKKVNDSYGHLIGDVALKSVAKCVADNLRPQDLFSRYGGEEFAVLLTDADLDVARVVAERLRSKTSETEISAGDVSFRVTLSIGITMTQDDGTLEKLIGEADQMLYRAKSQGRNRVEIFP